MLLLIDESLGFALVGRAVWMLRGCVKSCRASSLRPFDAGEGLSERTAPFDALALNLKGEADISTARIAESLRAGRSVAGVATRVRLTK